jgi:hypothetical protein
MDKAKKTTPIASTIMSSMWMLPFGQIKKAMNFAVRR